MQTKLRLTIALLCLTVILSGCGDSHISEDTLQEDTDPGITTETVGGAYTVPADTTQSEETQEFPVTETLRYIETEPLATETVVPETTPVDTKALGTEPVDTQPPGTEATETEAPATETTEPQSTDNITPDSIGNEADALKDSPAIIIQIPELLKASAPGYAAKDSGGAVIDFSNTKDGYVTVKYKHQTSTRLKVQVKGPKTTYTYNITPEELTVFPLSEGNGKYTVTVYQNVSGTKYATAVSASFEAVLKNEFSPFLYPNQYVDYSVAPNSVKKAYELTLGMTDPLEKVAAVYDFVVDTLTYDYEKAQNVKSGYLPELDKVLENKKGICFDYAALMTGMLRSLDIPCKLVVGYAGDTYHAWINVWSQKEGWIDGAIFFNGTSWQRMDPTFASSADRSQGIMDYIGNGKNYTEKYLY